MKSKRLQYQYRKNASKLHRTVGEILRTGLLKNYKIYQEYPVNRIDSSFTDGRCKFDWVILDLKVVIEVHGEQHYKCCTFGADPEEAVQNFRNIQKRDELKMEAAIRSGYTYIAIPYWDIKKVSDNYLLAKINKADLHADIPEVNIEYSKKDLLKAKQKAFRQAQYQKVKEFRKKLKDQKDGNS